MFPNDLWQFIVQNDIFFNKPLLDKFWSSFNVTENYIDS